MMDLDDDELWFTKYKRNYVSKDKILKALGYKENDEEYKRIYNQEEAILSIIHLINVECDRLEDIEDKKVMLEEHNIENMRDKYWKDKIRNKIKELKIECNKFCELGKILDCNTQCTIGGTIKAFEELLKE